MHASEQNANKIVQLSQLGQKVAGTTMDCAAICVQTIQYCLEMGGLHAAPKHIRILQDCVDACAMTGCFVLRRSQAQEYTAELCAEVCELCAVSCEQFPADPQMKACANQCKLCAILCHDLGHTAQELQAGVAAGAHFRSFSRRETT